MELPTEPVYYADHYTLYQRYLEIQDLLVSVAQELERMACDSRGNFGLFTMLWDHLLGTFVVDRPSPRDGDRRATRVPC